MKAAWQRIPAREQRLLQALSVFLLVILAFNLIWQPTRQRLESVERQYQQQQALAVQLQTAQPTGNAPAVMAQPLSLHLSESVAAAGLDLQQMEADNEVVRLSLSGDAKTLLQWLDHIERGGAVLQALTLEKREAMLEARVVVR